MVIRVILADSHGTITGKDQNAANLGLLYLAAYVRQNKLPVEFRYISMIHEAQHHLDQIREWNADVYAVSFTSFTAQRTYDLLNTIKRKFPEIITICGGSHPIAAYKDVLEKTNIDAVCIGEGEETFTAFLETIIGGNCSDFSHIPGLALIKERRIIKTPTRSAIKDLDTIPFPARDLVKNDEFCGLTYRKSAPSTGLTATRGCPFRCVFCATQYRYQDGPLYRTRSPQNIAEEAETLYQMGYREIYIYGDEINLSIDWTIAVCKELAALNHNDLYFQCNFRCTPVNKEIAYWLKRANVWLVHFGIESANERVLAGINKQMTVSKTVEACQILADEGIKVFAYLMLFNYWEEDGKLINETKHEVKKTINFAYKMHLRKLLHYCTWAYALPVPGAELYEIAEVAPVFRTRC